MTTTITMTTLAGLYAQPPAQRAATFTRWLAEEAAPPHYFDGWAISAAGTRAHGQALFRAGERALAATITGWARGRLRALLVTPIDPGEFDPRGAGAALCHLIKAHAPWYADAAGPDPAATLADLLDWWARFMIPVLAGPADTPDLQVRRAFEISIQQQTHDFADRIEAARAAAVDPAASHAESLAATDAALFLAALYARAAGDWLTRIGYGLSLWPVLDRLGCWSRAPLLPETERYAGKREPRMSRKERSLWVRHETVAQMVRAPMGAVFDLLERARDWHGARLDNPHRRACLADVRPMFA